MDSPRGPLLYAPRSCMPVRPIPEGTIRMEPKDSSTQPPKPPSRPSLPPSLERSLDDLARMIHEGLLPQAQVSLRRRPKQPTTS